MTLPADLALVERALNALERREVRVLVWGLVDSSLSSEEVDESLEDVLRESIDVMSASDCTIATSLELRRRMLSDGLLLEVPRVQVTAPARFRTRMGEGVRLLARLRQLFPHRHGGRDGWIAAPTLVADYRLLWRPRRYPRRNVGPTEAIEVIGPEASADTNEAIRHWLGKAQPGWALARFQINASRRILEGLEAGTPRGTIVAAGTGSGKTLAFYLPGLAWLAAQKRAHPAAGGVRVIALYPRNELLKDQLLEVFAQSRKFDDFLGRSGAKPISVGVLYGDTPETVGSATLDWQKNRSVCPFFRCPSCGGEMRLAQGAKRESDARLICSCGTAVTNDVLRVTRKAMREAPPDVLFTSVEMLNQRMSDSSTRHLFGLGPGAQRIPALMLLDEVHVYTGTYGAQVAHLIRRWSSLTSFRTSFVGLSATIAEGKAFFAALTNMSQAAVEEITPEHDDMVDEGAEYMIALRGDPVSQAALLSTSIQTLMLAARLLERRQDFHSSRPFAGWRAFAFTDQMDATNRLYYDLLDAEGRTKDGFPSTGKHPNGGLVHLRSPGPSLRRYEGGQDWRLIREIGHAFDTRLKVGRTTAYDSGVDSDAEIIVATSALEVGYDDPAVGVVVQHKAPRDLAQFVQRKGRAGRTRHMRPWTIMVLSDYGRDRLAYQGYEQFFDPQLPARELPLSNRYVRRMQAVYALVDYLGVSMQAGEPKGSVWRDLAAPKHYAAVDLWPDPARKDLVLLSNTVAFPVTETTWKSAKSKARNLAPARPADKQWEGANWLQARLRRVYLVKLLSDLLREPEKAEALARFICESLGLPREEVTPLLWDHPRPLLLGAIPTALRRLATDWRAHGVSQTDRFGSNPLPEFAPATLFSDLSLPEVRLVPPFTSAQEQRYLPVTQALSELAPGKVSRRLDKPLWLGPPEADLIACVTAAEDVVDVDIADWYVVDPQTAMHVATPDGVLAVDAYRPLDLNLSIPPSSKAANHLLVQDTSNARLKWRSQIFGRRAGAVFASPHARVALARLVRHVTVFTHQSHSPATVRRYAMSSRVDLRIQTSKERIDYTATWRFTRCGRPCGVGFEMEVDALCFTLDLPERIAETLGTDPDTQRAARSARYAWEAVHGDSLALVEGNPFLRMWLAQIFKVAAVALADDRKLSLAEAVREVAAPSEAHRLPDVLTKIFQSPDVPDEDDESASDTNATGAGQGTNGNGVASTTEPRLKQKLVAALGRVEVIAAVLDVAQRTLTAPFDDAWNPWLNAAVRDTLGAALMEAIQQTCPQIDADELLVDIDPGPDESGRVREDKELWISEANPGGNGLIEQLVEVLANDSAQFFRRVEAALQPSEFELIDQQLCDVIRRIGATPSDDRLVEVVHAIRSSPSAGDAQRRLVDLRRQLVEAGHAMFHGYVAALSTRLLRPGSPPALDELLAQLIESWKGLEARLGVEVDARVICAVFSNNPAIDQAFLAADFDLPTTNRESWRFSMLMGLMWARGHALRANALPLQVRFGDVPAVTERLLMSKWLTLPQTSIRASGAGWLQRLHQRLVAAGSATVSVLPDAADLGRVMAKLVTQPVQLEYLNVYPRLTSAERRTGEVLLHLSLDAAL